MKKTLLTTLALLGILIGAFVLYQNLSSQYDPSKLGPAGIYSNPEEDSVDTPLAGSEDESSSQEENSNSMAATDFTVYNQSGNAVNLSDYYGQPIVVNFWATWCGPCKSELPAFDNLYEAYGEDVHFLMVNLTDGAQDTVEGVSAFVEKNGYSFPVYYDTDYSAMMAYYVTSVPQTLFIDANGNIVASHTGSMSESTLQSYIENLLVQSTRK